MKCRYKSPTHIHLIWGVWALQQQPSCQACVYSERPLQKKKLYCTVMEVAGTQWWLMLSVDAKKQVKALEASRWFWQMSCNHGKACSHDSRQAYSSNYNYYKEKVCLTCFYSVHGCHQYIWQNSKNSVISNYILEKVLEKFILDLGNKTYFKVPFAAVPWLLISLLFFSFNLSTAISKVKNKLKVLSQHGKKVLKS